MGLPPSGDPAPPPDPAERLDLFIVEAGASRERRCVECGKRTARWKPVRRRGLSEVVCNECAAKAATGREEGGCPSCGTPVRSGDRFCGKCGARVEYACPACNAAIDADDAFCGKCGARVA